MADERQAATATATAPASPQEAQAPLEENTMMFSFPDGYISAQETATNTFLDSVPEAYRDRPWVREIAKAANPHEELYKGYEHAQRLVGSRSLQPPGEGASPEHIQAWNRAVGVPETVEGYSYDPIQLSEQEKPLADYLNESRNEELIGVMKQVALQQGVTPKQFKALIETYDKVFVEQNRQALQELYRIDQEINADFTKLAQEWFGPRADSVLTSGRKMLDAYVPPQYKQHLASLDNKSLLLLASVLDIVNQKYVREDTFRMPETTTSSAPLSLQDIREEGRRLMASEAFQNADHIDHKITVQKVKENYERQKLLR